MFPETKRGPAEVGEVTWNTKGDGDAVHDGPEGVIEGFNIPEGEEEDPKGLTGEGKGAFANVLGEPGSEGLKAVEGRNGKEIQ